MKELKVPNTYSKEDILYTIKQVKQGENYFKYFVCNEPFKILKTRITIDDKDNISIKYQGRCGNSNKLNRTEDKLFLTKESAQLKCDELNNILDIREIIIPDDFKKTQPAIYKIIEKLKYYERTGKFDRDIVVDRSYTLKDGYITYLLCKLFNMKFVQVVIQDDKANCFNCEHYIKIFNTRWICDISQDIVKNNGINIANKCTNRRFYKMRKEDN